VPYLDNKIEMGSGHQVIGHVTGFYSNIQPGLVRGSIQMEMETFSAYSPPSVTDDLQLALQVHDGTNWNDHTVKNMRLTEYFYGEVEGTLPPNVSVRFEIRVRRRADSPRLFGITHVRMFGAQCYPDFASASGCM
jgi:hypothetical protein